MSDANAIPQWFSGSEHTHRVAAAIAQYGPIARTTLAQMLGLSQGALSRITSDLIYAGVIEELPAEAGPSGKLPERFTPRESSDRRGRPQTSLVLCSNARTFIGVKVHGMSIVAAAVNAHGEVVSGRHEVPIGADQSAEYVVSAITRLVRECSADIASSGLPSPHCGGRCGRWACGRRFDCDVRAVPALGRGHGLGNDGHRGDRSAVRGVQ